jgi:hypothetical protein
VENKKTAVYGIYLNATMAEEAVDHLLAAGVADNDVSILMADTDSTRAFAHQKATKAPEGTATGATAGGVIGGALGLLAGIGALAIPGRRPAHRCWPNHGWSRWVRSWRSSRRPARSSRRSRHPRVRSKAL